MRRALAAVTLAIMLPSCAGDDGVEVELDEYALEAPAEAAAGEVTFRARNAGAIDHELVVLRTIRGADDLPVDDSEVQEDAPGIDVVAKTRTIEPGGTRVLSARLRPGPYVLICNVPGHYQSGMRRVLRAI